MQSSSSRQPSGLLTDKALNTIFFAALAAFVVLVLALPVFPSGDGPVHIYYAHILALLAAHPLGAYGGGVYGSVYVIRHLVQPYALHYFWLIACERFASVALAEKSFVAAILLVNALGFRFLARQLGPASGLVSLWILPLLLSWALGSGFFNFCFAAGLLFFACGLYLRLLVHLQAATVAAYVLVLVLLILAHPVPLLLLILVLLGEWMLAAWAAVTGRRATGPRVFPARALALLLACLAFVFPMLIADKASVADSLLRDLRPHLSQLEAMASGDRLSLFFAATPAGVLFTLSLVALVPAAVLLVARQGAAGRLRMGTATAAERLCLIALVLLVTTIVFPQSMNGSALFADRMVPLLWPLIFVCAAGVPWPARVARASLPLALAATAASLLFAGLYLLPAARQQQALTLADLPRNARGLFATGVPVRRPFAPHLAGQLLGWGGARAFSAHQDVLLNSPWMQLTIVPVGERGRAGLLRDRLPGSLSESPAQLAALLRTHSPAATQALATADFLLYSDPARGEARQTDLIAEDAAALLPPQSWRCTARGFYAVCVRQGAP